MLMCIVCHIENWGSPQMLSFFHVPAICGASFHSLALVTHTVAQSQVMELEFVVTPLRTVHVALFSTVQ